MPCCLTPSTSADGDFTGKTGCDVSLTVQAPKGVKARIIHIRYAGTEIDNEPPFEFTIKKGQKFLVVLAEATKPGAELQLVETCNGTENVIDRFHYDPRNPARGYVVVGE